MTAADPEELLEVARAAADAGAAVARDWQRRADELRIEEKAASDDLVSQADRETEAAILSVITRRRPGDGVLGEETGDQAGTTGVRWVVDPIDGTTNYLYGRPDWAVSVAALDDSGDVVAGVVGEPAVERTTYACTGGGTWTDGRQLPVLGRTDLTRALVELNGGRPDQRDLFGDVVTRLVGQVRDVRRGGSAAAALAQVADGRADAAWLPGLQPWDCAAGILLVSEVGGIVGDLTGPLGARVPPSGDVLAAPGALWKQLHDLLQPAFGG